MVDYPMSVKTNVECYVYDIDTPNEYKIAHNGGPREDP